MSVLFVLNVILFLAMWTSAWLVTESYPQVTFSDMLAKNTPQGETVRQLYLIYYGFRSGIKIAIIILVTQYYVNDLIHHPKEERKCVHHHEHCLLFSFKWLFVFAAIAEAVGYLGLFFFPVTTQSEIHFGFTATGFLGSLFSCWALFLRRHIVATHFSSKAINAITGAYNPWYKYIMSFNLLILVSATAMAITIVSIRCGGVPCTGVYEFIFCLLLDLDPAWQIYDFASEPDPKGTYQQIPNLAAPMHVILKSSASFVDRAWKRARRRAHTSSSNPI